MHTKIIETLEEKMSALKEQTAREIAEIFAYLSQTGAKTRLRPRIKQNKGYVAFSICWRKISYFNKKIPRATKAKEIRKGRGYKVPKARLLSHCRNCDSWEVEYIMDKEKGFARIREKVHLLSTAIQALRAYDNAHQESYPE